MATREIDDDVLAQEAEPFTENELRMLCLYSSMLDGARGGDLARIAAKVAYRIAHPETR